MSSQTQANHKFPLLSIVAFLQGLLLGFVWLFPVYEPPSREIVPMIQGSWRVIRVIATLALIGMPLFFGFRFSKKHLTSPAFFFQTIIFFLIPFICSALVTRDVTTLQFAVIPLLLTWSCFVLLGYQTQYSIQGLLCGIATAGFIFICLKLVSQGIEMSTHYSRSRALFGFRHPLDSASACLAILTGALASISTKRGIIARLFFAIIVILAIIGINLTGTRNILLYVAGTSLGGGVLLALRNRRLTRVLVFSLIGVIPLFVTSLFVLSDLGAKVVDTNPDATNSIIHRLHAIKTIRSEINFKLQNNWGPSFQLEYGPIANGFSVYDSVYLNYWHHFGYFGFLLFNFSWIGLGLVLAYKKPDNNLTYYWCAGSWIGLSLFFTFDGQGLTISNLSLFLPFALALSQSNRIDTSLSMSSKSF
jgi:hypothetical protein